MMIAAVTRADRAIAMPSMGRRQAGFEAALAAQATPAAGDDARTSAAAAVAAFDLDYGAGGHSRADVEAHYAEGARTVSAAQGLPEGRYDFSAMSPRELRIVTGHLVLSGVARCDAMAQLTAPIDTGDGSTTAGAPTDWLATLNHRITDAKARVDGDAIYLESAGFTLQRFHTKSDRAPGAGPLASSAPMTAGAKLDAALEAFRKEGKMTPAERMRRQVMKEMKITEDDLKAMPPEQRDATEKKIGEEVALRLKKLGIDGGGAGTRSVEEYVAAQG